MDKEWHDELHRKTKTGGLSDPIEDAFMASWLWIPDPSAQGHAGLGRVMSVAFRAGAEWMRAEAVKAVEAERFTNLHRRDMKALVVRLLSRLGSPRAEGGA